ncbi:MAG TPA: PQQ-binding-like beta-propeller repeat protein [Bryobacteraceae bacterium]|nr:PQQ-binding-like beta-propeller repeat protein [Bryobacteraceae bacterium]
MSCIRSFWICVLLFPLSAQVNVLTYQYDNSRAGQNVQESVLIKSNVTVSQFGKLFSYPVDGYIYGQPLYLPNVTIPQKGVHDVVYVATENDSVYAFDADTNSGSNSGPLWQVNFLNPAAGVTAVPYQDTGCSQITPELGITSTPVIDAQSGTIYVVAMTKETSGSTTSYVHRLHALDVATGAERPGSPVAIQAAVPGTGEGGATVVFRAKDYKQRAGLVLWNGTVYTAWASHCDIGQYHGWLIAYDAKTLTQTAVYNNTPDGNQASLWDGGAAPAVDNSGNLYVVGGNGSFTAGSRNTGESYLKLSTSQGLTLADYFTPFNYAALNEGDLDVGSAGVALLPDEAGSSQRPHLMVGAGKEGRIYLLDRDNMGKVQVGSDSQIVQSLPGAVGELFGNPAYFNQAVYFCGSGDTLKAFSITNARMSASPVSQSSARFDFPGCVPTISANGAANGIVWALDPAGTLHAFDASNLGNELYNSNQNQARDALGATVKFSVPTVVNGKVYAGTQAALVVYGLLSGIATSLVNAASGDATALAPGSLASIYGSGLAPSIASAATFPLPSTLGGAAISVNGIAAPLLYAGPNQLNFQVPYEVSGAAILNVTAGGQASATAALHDTAPGVFQLSSGRAAILNQDGSINGADHPAAVGEVVVVFATGLGAVSPPASTGAQAVAFPPSVVVAKVTATVGGQPATVLFAGLAPGYAGLDQVNFAVPKLASGDYPLQITAGGAVSNTPLISVR